MVSIIQKNAFTFEELMKRLNNSKKDFEIF